MKPLYWYSTLWLAATLTLAACASAPQPAPTAPNPSQPASLTPIPSETALPTETITPTNTPTATPTLYPLAIQAMRARTYPGSDIVIEQTLRAGTNYNRYIASYQSEGLKIYGLLTVPNGEQPASGWPVIIFNHGYIPPREYRTLERYVAYVDLIARSGYIVFKADYRGHDKSEGVARGAYGYPDYVIDVLNELAALKKFPAADPQRIGIWGHSMGGYISLRAMVIAPDIKAGVIWAGVVGTYADIAYNWRRDAAGAVTPTPFAGYSWRSTLVETYGSPEQNPAFWNSISANSFLGEISGPLQLHHGTADDEVPLAFSENLFYQMLAAGKYVELYKYPDDNHNISNYFNLAMQRSLEFFDRFVKNP
jgi:uncharacterized protein